MSDNINYRLTSAIRDGNIKRVKELVHSFGLSYLQEWSEGYVLLVQAVRRRHPEIAKLLLMCGCKVNSRNKQSSDTPLRLAIANGYVEIVEMLLHRGADIHFRDTRGSTVLHTAAQQGNMEIIELLLNRGANVHTVDNNGQNPLYLAVRERRETVVKQLLARGANNCQDKFGNTILHLAVQITNNNRKIVENLLQYGFIVYPEDVGKPKFLHNAVANGHSKIVEDLLKLGADVNMSDDSKYENGRTPLHIAAMHTQEEVAKLLVNYGANVNAKDKSGKSPVFYAVEESNAIITKLLLANGADIKDNCRLLRSAVLNGCLEIIDDLLKYGADVNMSDDSKYGNGRTPLHIAAMHTQEEVAKQLVNYGANVNAKDKSGKSPVFYAVEESNAIITKLLLANGADIKDNCRLLHSAVLNGCLEIIDDLLKYGADVNMSDDSKYGNGRTPLHIAAMHTQEEVAKLLVNYGANVNAKDKSGKSPVLYAVEKGNAIITKLLLANGADIKYDHELLHSAVVFGCLEIVEDLLKYGAVVNMSGDSKYENGRTPLHIAAMHTQEEVAKLLVNYGANVNAKDKNGKTPVFYAVEKSNAIITRLLLTNGADIKYDPELLHFAVAKGCLEIVEDLLKYGADVNMSDDSKYGNGRTPLHIAAMHTQEEVAKLLVNYGANVNAKDKSGKSPVFYAVEESNAIITKLLIANGADIKYDPELLHSAVARRCLKIVEDLLKYGADVNMSDDSKYGNGRTPLHIAAMHTQEEVAKLLVNYGANVNAKDKSGKSPVFYAVEESNAIITKLLLANGANIKDNCRLLHSAVLNGCLEIIDDLLKYGADVNMSGDSEYGHGRTPLHIAAMHMQEEVAKQLVNYGANVNAKDKSGKSPVFYAVEKGNAIITKLLLANGADIKYDHELLHSAVVFGCLEIVEDLLKYGADVNVISNHRTPLEYAMFHRRHIHLCEVVMLLKKHIAMLQVVGFYVNERNLELLINDCEFTHFQHECEGEIEIMKCEKISNSYVSFYDILTKNIHQLAIYAKNENIVQAFKSVDYYSKFPMYASMMAGKFRKGLERKELMELGNQFIHSFFKSIIDLPLLCIEKILSYLSNYDLKLIIQKSCLNR